MNEVEFPFVLRLSPGQTLTLHSQTPGTGRCRVLDPDPPTRAQLRRHSFAEAIVNTAVGFVLSNLAWPAVQVLILHQPYSWSQGLGAVAVFTILSVARNYVCRRLFNRNHYSRGTS